MAKLRWLQVNKFRTVKPGTRLTFNPSYNVLIGQNGTGKTTLLNLVSAVVRSDFSEFGDLEFDLQYELESNMGTATFAVCQQRRMDAQLPAQEDIPPSLLSTLMLTKSGPQRPSFFAHVKFTPTSAAHPVTVDIEDSRVTVHAQGESSNRPLVMVDAQRNSTLRSSIGAGVVRWHQSNDIDKKDHSTLDLFAVTNSNLPAIRFDESLEYFDHLRNITLDVRRFTDGSIGLSQFLPELFEPLTDLLKERWGEDRYTFREERLPFLKEAVRQLDFQSAEAIIELMEASGAASMRLGNLKFIFTHRGGWRISERQLSYGQKRMLAFLHYLSTVQSVAIADELVNGLHHRWIRACIEALGDRQVFLTSQNPLLLDYLTFESPEEVRSKFILCRWEQGPEQMVWENMSQEAAEDFFDSYKVGFQQVGELLQTKGLW